MPSFLVDLHSGTGSTVEPTHIHKPSFQSKDSNFFVIPSKNPTKISPFRIDIHSGTADWASLPNDMLVLIAERLDYFEDFLNFSLVCNSWQSVSSISLPPRFPWVMLTDIAEKNFPRKTKDMDTLDMLVEEVEKNEKIEGMNKRQFYSFSSSKTYEFELPEATLKKCLGVGNGWLMTIGYDLQINLLHPFSRQQVGMPHFLSFKGQYEYDDEMKPQEVVSFFVWKAVMSSNYNSSNEDCIVLAIYGEFRSLAFARPGDKVWTDIYPPSKHYQDVIYSKGKFYAIDFRGAVVVCDIHNVKRPTATPITCLPKGPRMSSKKYLVESSGSLLVVVRSRKGPSWPDFAIRVAEDDDTEDDAEDDDTEDDETEDDDTEDDAEDDDTNNTEDEVDDTEEDDEFSPHYTVGFSIFKLEECHGDMNIDAYPYKLTPLKNLGDESLFLGYNASVSLPCSNNVKANHIYFCEDDPIPYGMQPYGGGFDTGIYDVESCSITKHYASKFTSHLTPPMWYV